MSAELPHTPHATELPEGYEKNLLSPEFWEKRLAKEGMPAELPPNMAFSVRHSQKVLRVTTMLQNQNGVPPTSDEIADELAKDKRFPSQVLPFVRQLGQQILTPHPENFFSASREIAFDTTEVIDYRLSLSAAVQKTLSHFAATGLFEDIAPKHRHVYVGVLALSFGLPNPFACDPRTPYNQPLTDDQIADTYDCSVTAIRHYRDRALRTLRQTAYANRLVEFYGDPPHSALFRDTALPQTPDTQADARDEARSGPMLERLILRTQQDDAAAGLRELYRRSIVYISEGLEAPRELYKLAERYGPTAVRRNGRDYTASRDDPATAYLLEQGTWLYDHNILRAKALQELQAVLGGKINELSSWKDNSNADSEELARRVSRAKGLQRLQQILDHHIRQFYWRSSSTETVRTTLDELYNTL